MRRLAIVMPRRKEIVLEVGRYDSAKGRYVAEEEAAVIEQADGDEGRTEFRLRYRYREDDGKLTPANRPLILPPEELQKLFDAARRRGWVR